MHRKGTMTVLLVRERDRLFQYAMMNQSMYCLFYNNGESDARQTL